MLHRAVGGQGGCRHKLGHYTAIARTLRALASYRLRKGCPGAMSSTRTTQIWRGASIGRAVRVGGAVRLFLAHLEFPLDLLGNLPKCHYRSSRRLYPLASAWGVDLATISTEAT